MKKSGCLQKDEESNFIFSSYYTGITVGVMTSGAFYRGLAFVMNLSDKSGSAATCMQKGESK